MQRSDEINIGSSQNCCPGGGGHSQAVAGWCRKGAAALIVSLCRGIRAACHCSSCIECSEDLLFPSYQVTQNQRNIEDLSPQGGHFRVLQHIGWKLKVWSWTLFWPVVTKPHGVSKGRIIVPLRKQSSFPDVRFQQWSLQSADSPSTTFKARSSCGLLQAVAITVFLDLRVTVAVLCGDHNYYFCSHRHCLCPVAH